MARTKLNPARRLTHVTHARLFLKKKLREGGTDHSEALQVFRRFYRANDAKLEALLTENATLTIGRRHDTWNTKCFLINGQSITTGLSSPTKHGIVVHALRATEYATRPNHLKRQNGMEMDHQNAGGFHDIKREFIAIHGLEAISNAVDNTEQLCGDMRRAFVSFHASKTRHYRLCKMLTVQEHRRITEQRMRQESAV
eukprot:COSAG04_NODE_104_length_26097_cov_12.466074_25_plen_198_part_00